MRFVGGRSRRTSGSASRPPPGAGAYRRKPLRMNGLEEWHQLNGCFQVRLEACSSGTGVKHRHSLPVGMSDGLIRSRASQAMTERLLGGRLVSRILLYCIGKCSRSTISSPAPAGILTQVQYACTDARPVRDRFLSRTASEMFQGGHFTLASLLNLPAQSASQA